MKGVRIVGDRDRPDKLQLQVRSSCIAIVDRGQFMGILTDRDLVMLGAEGQDLGTLAIRNAIGTKSVTLKVADFTDISVAIDLIERHHLRYLPIVDDRDCLMGLVAHESLQSHLTEALSAKVAQLESEKVELLEHRHIALSEAGEEYTQLAAKIAQEQLIGQISNQIRASLNLTQILDTAVRELQGILECDRVSIWKCLADGCTLEVVADYHWHERLHTLPDSNKLEKQATDSYLDFTAFLNGKIHTLSDTHTADLSDRNRDLLVGLEIRSQISVPILPILESDLPWGLIQAIESDRPRVWQLEEIELLQQIATQMAIAIQQATTYERFQNLNTELESRVAQRTAQLQEREAQLQESQQFLQTVIETFPLAVFWKDRESRYLGCNSNFAQDANLNSPQEIVGKTDYDLSWGAVEGDAYRADDRQVIDSELAKLGIIETQTLEDGSSRWLETNKLPLRNYDGDTIGVLGTYHDITDRKQAEIELSRLSERLSLSLKSGAIGCWEWDIVRDAIVWDDRMYELYGLTKTSASKIYSFWIEAIHPDDRADTEALVARVLSGQADFDTEYRVIHPDGSIHFIKAYGLLEQARQDCSYSLIGINFDITAAKQDDLMRQQNERMMLQQAERESVLREIAQRIRKSLDLKTVFETAVIEIRHFMETDRVGIFKFNSNANFEEGKFVAESVDSNFASILGVTIDEPSFGENLAHFYQTGRINVLEDIHAAGLQDFEIEVLAKFQVQASLVIPLLNGPVLWGLLCIHHCREHRSWQQSEINFVTQIAEQIGIGIQQATLYEKVQFELEIRWQAEEAIAFQLRQQQTLGALAQQIRNSLNVTEILATATEQVKELMMVDRASIFQVFPNGRLRAVEEVVSPEYPRAIDRNWDNEYLSNEEFEFYLDGNPNVVFDLQQDPRSASLQKYIEDIGVKSKIVVPILLLFGNSATDREVETWDEPHLWGLLSVHSCSDRRHWQDAEVKLVQQVADQLALAIHQASLFEKLQQELLERQQAETRAIESNQQLAVSNQELARANRLKDEFLASMSHELRTPLNVILGISESLQDGVFGAPNERQQKSIATIEKSGRHLLALINDILDLSKIEANKFSLEFTDVSIQSLCQNSVLFVKELALKRQIRLKTQLPEQLKHLHIRVDDLRCRQVLINLLSNAVKFTPEGGSITLDVRVVAGKMGSGVDGWMGGWEDIPIEPEELTSIAQNTSTPPLRQIAFSIIDTGIGIAPENMHKLFQSFVQIDSSLSRQYAGTGLGLALVKRIVEMHGGSVSVESELNRGSCFTVYLPFCASTEMAAQLSSSPLVDPFATATEPAEIPMVCTQPVILLVEDDEGTMETMTTYLSSRGYQLVVAQNGQQAISMLENCATDLARLHYPDLILMDIQMPGMDGFEATERIRQLPDCATIPIVALTALAMPNDAKRCLDAGADRYVTKPVKLSQLVATIETLVKK